MNKLEWKILLVVLVIVVVLLVITYLIINGYLPLQSASIARASTSSISGGGGLQ